MEINRVKGPAVIISPSGMCTAGRVKHHLKHNISNSDNTILFVGYQAEHTLGRIIQSGRSPVRIFGDWFDVRADVRTMEGFSAHADLDELLEWFDAMGGAPERTFIVHGEERAARSLASHLRTRSGAAVDVPERDEVFFLA
jgi:metallo-beta-lactamase family protein